MKSGLLRIPKASGGPNDDVRLPSWTSQSSECNGSQSSDCSITVSMSSLLSNPLGAYEAGDIPSTLASPLSLAAAAAALAKAGSNSNQDCAVHYIHDSKKHGCQESSFGENVAVDADHQTVNLEPASSPLPLHKQIHHNVQHQLAGATFVQHSGCPRPNATTIGTSISCWDASTTNLQGKQQPQPQQPLLQHNPTNNPCASSFLSPNPKRPACSPAAPHRPHRTALGSNSRILPLLPALASRPGPASDHLIPTVTATRRPATANTPPMPVPKQPPAVCLQRRRAAAGAMQWFDPPSPVDRRPRPTTGEFDIRENKTLCAIMRHFAAARKQRSKRPSGQPMEPLRLIAGFELS